MPQKIWYIQNEFVMSTGRPSVGSLSKFDAPEESWNNMHDSWEVILRKISNSLDSEQREITLLANLECGRLQLWCCFQYVNEQELLLTMIVEPLAPGAVVFSSVE